MTALVYNASAPRKAINLTVNSDLLGKAKERRINVSSVLEAALVEELRKWEKADWQEEAREAVEIYNKKVSEIGLFSDGIRSL